MIDPVLVQIGPLQVHWYGVIIASAVLLSGVLGSIEARRRGMDPEVGWSMLLPVLILAVIGARLYHVIHEWGFYSQRPALIPQVWLGGLGIPGAVVGGVLAIWAYTRWQGLNTLRWMDVFATALLLGQAIGRLGNFVNQELYGPPTTLPWGIPIDAQHRVGEWMNLAQYPVETTRFHPLFAYEALLNLVGLALILWIARRFAHRLYDGDVLLMYLMWYGAVRSVLEPLRTGNWIILGVPTAIWLGVLAVVGAGFLLWLRHRRGWGTPGAWMKEQAQTDGDAEPSESDAGARPEPSTG
ncbi:MAG TPA: prolipoprotein diacylglyceryl transferase [candidate division Zixibacteria bacterium]|nr:prolipoprotein diacylglyceryl transferase [candidate division Zixibacteria bacterium]